MRPILIGIALALSLSATALAQEPAQPAVMTKVEDEVRSFVGSVQPLIKLHESAVDLLVKTIDLIDPALALAERRAPKRDVEAWIKSWEPAQQQKIAAMRREVKTARPLTAKDYPLMLAMRRAQGVDVDRMLATPVRISELTISTLNTVERITNDVKQGATGNVTALDRLAHSLVSGPIALIEAENTTLELSLASMPNANPQRSLGLSFMDANLAVLDLMKGVEQEMDDKTVDHAAIAKSMRSHIGDGRRHSDEVATMADRFLKDSASDAEAKTAFGQKILVAYRSFGDSAAVERQIYDLLEQLVLKVEKGADLVDVVEDTNTLDKLVDRRSELNMQRIQVLAR